MLASDYGQYGKLGVDFTPLQKHLSMNLRSLVWRFSPRFVMTTYARLTVLRLPDRVFLSNEIIPAAIKQGHRRALNIGVHYYTQHTHSQLIQGGLELHTADIDDRKTIWGVHGRHAVCGAADLSRFFPPSYFDLVILNGVLGYGIDDKPHIQQTLRSIADVMSEGGVLVVGWDENMSDDPMKGTFCEHHFQRNSELAGQSRIRKPNGLFDPGGKASFKIFDVLTKVAR